MLTRDPPRSGPAPAPEPPVSLADRPTPTDLASPPGRLWEMVRSLTEGSRVMGALVEQLTLDRVEGGVAVLTADPSVAVTARSRATELEQLASRAWQTRVTLRIVDAEAPAPPAGEETPRVSMSEHPLVRLAVDELGARLIAVQPRARPPRE